MKFSLAALLATAATLASATNTVTFVSQDSIDRTIYFTSNPGFADLDATSVPGGENVTVVFPDGWQGNWYSVSDGSENKSGMLGEIAFQSWNSLTFFDVSAIVNAEDDDGVKEIYPADSKTPKSGCSSYAVRCAFAYYLPDDVQTLATTESDFVCTLGGSNSNAVNTRDIQEKADAPLFTRDFVLGRWSNKAESATTKAIKRHAHRHSRHLH